MIKSVFITLSFLFITSFAASADVLLIERVEAKAGLDVPKKSATMSQVRAQYGDPMAESAAVGEPPITRWEYPGYIVYFEHQHVITTVLKKSQATETQPESIE